MSAIPVTALVAGGGPAGLAAAALLGRSGIDTCVAAPPAASDPRTIALMEPSIRLLRHLDIWPGELASAACPLRRLRLIDDTGSLFSAPTITFEAEEIGLEAFGWNIPLDQLTRALRARVADLRIPVIEDRVTGAKHDGSTVEVHLASGQTYAARVVVAADGRDSLLRSAAGIGVDRTDYAQTALATVFCHTAPHGETSTEHHTAGGPFTTVPLPGLRSGLVWMAPHERIQKMIALCDDELATEIQIHSHGVLGRIHQIGPRKLFPMTRLVARRFAAARTFLIGESGHVFPPLGAQGLNLSFRDAAHAAEAILGARDDPGTDAVMAEFDSLRRSDIVPRVAAIDAMNRSLLLNLLPIDALRAGALAAIDSIPMLRRLAMSRGLGVTGALPLAMQG